MSHRLCAVIGFLLLAAGSVLGQQLTGAIEGTVVDPQGAVIPGVRVVGTHLETNTLYEAETSAVGQFAFPIVRLGKYNIAAELDGFKRAVITGVQVTVGGTTSVNITMEIGAVQEEVTVTADLAQVIVNTVDAEISSVVDDRRVLELPLNGRNAVELTLQQAGVYFERSPDGQGNKLFVNGQRHNSLQITLDGVSTQDNFIKTSTIMVDQPLLAVTAENTQEFRVVTGLASAEYSQGGSHVSAVTRAGTNEYHGSLFWFNRNDAFSANDFFNNSATPKVDTPPLNRNQFGGRIGGPILKNKFFFYVGYQQTRESRGNSVNRTVYTAEALQGIFRYVEGVRTTPESVAQNPDKIRTINLFECGSNIMSQFDRECFDGRFNLSNRPGVDPIMRTVFGVMPQPNNFDVGDGLNTGGLRFNSKSLTVEHLPSVRLDYRINDANSLYGTINYTDRDIDGDFINDREPRFPGMDSLGSRITHAKGFSLAWTSTLRPTLVNELRLGFLGGENAFIVNQPFGTPYTLDLNTISDPYATGGNGSDVRDNRTINVRNVTSWMKGNHQLKFGFEWRQRFAETYSEDLVGRLKEINMDDNDAPPGFSTTDLRNFGGGSINSSDSENARDLMNNLVGAVEDVIERFNVTSLNSGFVPLAVERRKYRNDAIDLFINDSWRIKPGLTLNLGLRWEWAGVPVETEGLGLNPEGGILAAYGVSGPGGFFNPGSFNGTPCSTLGQLPMDVTTANARALIQDCATVYLPATATNGRPLWDNDYNNFAPVISIAWDPFGDGKTSIRTGFRISYLRDNFNIVDGNLDDNEGLRVNQQCNPVEGPTCNSGAEFLGQIQNSGIPTPNTPEFALPASRTILDSSTIDFRTFDRGLKTPYYNEWTFGISREIGKGWAVEARYVGNRGVGLRRVADYNEINVNAVDPVTGQSFLDAFRIAQQNLACNDGSRFNDTGAACIIPNPLMEALIAGEASRLGNRTGLITALERNQTGEFVHRLTQVETSRPRSGQSRIRGGSFWGQVLTGRFPVNFFQTNPFVASARSMVNDGFSTYHSLQLEVRRRFAEGLSVQTNYTYGKALADYDGDESTLVNDVRASSVINPRYSKQEFMPRHQLNANWVYELPLGTGKPFLNSGGALNKFVGGWQLGGLLAFRSGRPLSITSNVGTFHRNAVSDDNTVDPVSGVTSTGLRDSTGVRDIGSGVFWIDPCFSGFNNVDCTGSGGVQSGLAMPQPGQLGALGQTVLFGPNRFLLDMSLMKRTPIGERFDLEFRWEVFNVLNRTNLGAPTLDITSASFGQIQNTITEPRLMQFALKLNF